MEFFIDLTLEKSSQVLRNLYIAIDIITNHSIVLEFRVEGYVNFVPTKKV